MAQKSNLTIDDVAKELGVSKTTVSRAISGKGRISQATRERVLTYIQAHNYRPNAAAKGLAESRTYNLALVLPYSMYRLDEPFIRQSMTAICAEAFQYDYNVMLCLCTYNYSDPLVRTIDHRKVDGVIVSRTAENDRLIDLLSDREIPFATLGSLPARLQGTAAVEADHDQAAGCCAFTKALLTGKSGKTALLGNDLSYIVNQNRLSGFHTACQELKIPTELAPVRMGINGPAACREAVEALAASGVRRFLCMDEQICLHTAQTLEAMGMRIPEDAELASFYDDDSLASHTPSISALRFDAADLGRAACRELVRSLQGEPFESRPRLGYEIFLRESTV